MTSTQTVSEPSTPIFEASRRGDAESPSDADPVPLASDLAAGPASALRVGFGTMVASWGVSTLTPVASAFVLSSGGHPQDEWFTCALGMLLVTSGAMTVANRLVPLAMTLLVPLSLHVLFQLAHV
jgi:hypothetical protein